MQNTFRIITGIITIISYLIGLGFIVIGEIGLKKLKKEFRKLNCDVSETERKNVSHI
jgi:multisubunit Na+/H+ antiporter MnhG subunit